MDLFYLLNFLIYLVYVEEIIIYVIFVFLMVFLGYLLYFRYIMLIRKMLFGVCYLNIKIIMWKLGNKRLNIMCL